MSYTLPSPGSCVSLIEVTEHYAKFPKEQWQGEKNLDLSGKEERCLVPGRIEL